MRAVGDMIVGASVKEHKGDGDVSDDGSVSSTEGGKANFEDAKDRWMNDELSLKVGGPINPMIYSGLKETISLNSAYLEEGKVSILKRFGVGKQ